MICRWLVHLAQNTSVFIINLLSEYERHTKSRWDYKKQRSHKWWWTCSFLRKFPIAGRPTDSIFVRSSDIKTSGLPSEPVTLVSCTSFSPASRSTRNMTYRACMWAWKSKEQGKRYSSVFKPTKARNKRTNVWQAAREKTLAPDQMIVVLFLKKTSSIWLTKIKLMENRTLLQSS